MPPNMEGGKNLCKAPLYLQVTNFIFSIIHPQQMCLGCRKFDIITINLSNLFAVAIRSNLTGVMLFLTKNVYQPLRPLAGHP